jgi:hypothetical protein
MAGMTVLNLLRRVFEANAAKAKEMAEQTKKAAEEAKKLRLEGIANRKETEKLPAIGEPGAIEARQKNIENYEAELREMTAVALKETTKLQDKLTALEEERQSILRGSQKGGPLRFVRIEEEIAKTRKALAAPPGGRREQIQDTIATLRMQIAAEEDIRAIRGGALADLEEQKKALQELLGVEEGRGAALKERAPVRATAQFVGAAELWKQTQASVAGSAAREQVQAIKQSVTEQKGIRKAVENIEKLLANLKSSSGPNVFTE